MLASWPQNLWQKKNEMQILKEARIAERQLKIQTKIDKDAKLVQNSSNIMEKVNIIIN